MKTRIRTTYNCDFCSKLYVRKDMAERHENMCTKNPANNRPCFECIHLKKKKTEVYSGYDHYGSGEPATHEVEAFYCSKKEHYLYTPQNEIKGNAFEIAWDEDVNEPMPKECNLQETDFFGEI